MVGALTKHLSGFEIGGPRQRDLANWGRYDSSRVSLGLVWKFAYGVRPAVGVPAMLVICPRVESAKIFMGDDKGPRGDEVSSLLARHGPARLTRPSIL